MADARLVADRLLELAAADGRERTPMQLPKLAYIAHGWHLALHGRAPPEPLGPQVGDSFS